MCLDWDMMDIEMFGVFTGTTNYQSVDLVVVPCNMRLPCIGLLDDSFDSECIADKRA